MLGILGGMGPAATADFYAKVVALTTAERDQDHFPTIIWADTQVPDRSAALLNIHNASPVPALRAGVQQLEKMGATLIAIPCNTAHHWHADIQRSTSCTVLHIADTVLEELRADEYATGRKIGLFATTGTLISGFYQRWLGQAGLTPVIPTPTAQAEIIDAIQCAKAGQYAAGREAMLSAIAEMQADGVDTFLLGCTELPLLIGDEFASCKFIDSTKCLARAVVRRMQSSRIL
jgi:aspartate racemase